MAGAVAPHCFIEGKPWSSSSLVLAWGELRVASGLWTPLQCLYSGLGSLKSAAATIRHDAYQSAIMVNAACRSPGFNLRNNVRAFLMSRSESLSAAALRATVVG